MKFELIISFALIASLAATSCASKGLNPNALRTGQSQPTQSSLNFVPGESQTESADSANIVDENYELDSVSGSAASGDIASHAGSSNEFSSGIQPAPMTPGGTSGSGYANQDPNSSELIPDGWPEYIPVYEGFSVKYGGKDDKAMYVIASGDAPSFEVARFYLALEGWEIQDVPEDLQRNSSGTDSESIETYYLRRANETLAFSISEEEEGKTILSLMYQKQR
jgi:hypothetical protein